MPRNQSPTSNRFVVVWQDMLVEDDVLFAAPAPYPNLMGVNMMIFNTT